MAFNRIIPSEHQEQCRVIAWADAMSRRFPDLWLLHAIPNAGKRTPVTGSRMKKEGLRRGVPDLDLPVSRGTYIGLRIEMKKIEGGDLKDPDQMEWQRRLALAGHCVVVCKGADAAIKVIEWYLKSEWKP